MDYYSHTGHKIMIGHFPGQTKLENAELIKELSLRAVKIPDNIDIISVMTKDNIESSPLHQQLTSSNISYINSIKDRNMLWDKVDKIKYVIDSLKQATKEYSLVLDGNDVVILSDLTNIISVFNTYNKKVLYNASIWMHPHVIVDNVENRGQYGEYCYLNAGCAFGKTDDLLDFYQSAWDITKTSCNAFDSEQYYIRKEFNKRQDTVFFDYACRIFQCWHKAEYEYRKEMSIAPMSGHTTGNPTVEEEKCYLR